ncbi:MAG: glycosyltransferase [Candidatus Merdivicinus sp.]|jgi:glycosyltransferase involved in cell wall biosynthesis
MIEKKVLMGILPRGTSGKISYMMELFRHMDREKYHFTFLAECPDSYYEKEILASGGEIRVITPRRKNPLQHKKDLKHVMQEGFDVCHIHFTTASNLDALKIAKKVGIPVVIAHSHSAGTEGSRLGAMLHYWNAPKIRKYTTVRLACSKLAGQFLFAGADFLVAKNSIDTARFDFSEETRTRMRAELQVEGKFVVGHIGRIAEAKNPRFLIETFAEIHQLRPDSVLVYAGQGPLLEEMKQLAGQLGIADAVHFVGQVSNPQEYLCAFDCFVLPSRFEGLGFVVIESVCSGLRCFASDVIPEEARVSDLVELFSLSDDKKNLAQRILDRCGQDLPRTGCTDLLTKLGYDIDSQRKQMEAIYNGLLKSSRED